MSLICFQFIAALAGLPRAPPPAMGPGDVTVGGKRLSVNAIIEHEAKRRKEAGKSHSMEISPLTMSSQASTAASSPGKDLLMSEMAKTATPQRPCSAYLAFAREQLHNTRKMNPSRPIDAAAFGVLAARQWMALTDEQRKPYMDAFDAKMEEYRMLKAAAMITTDKKQQQEGEEEQASKSS